MTTSYETFMDSLEEYITQAVNLSENIINENSSFSATASSPSKKYKILEDAVLKIMEVKE